MGKTVFYSWQKELPNRTNRTLIGDALEQAVKATDVESIAVDRDTQGVPGAPDIRQTILRKIDECEAAIAE